MDNESIRVCVLRLRLFSSGSGVCRLLTKRTNGLRGTYPYIKYPCMRIVIIIKYCAPFYSFQLGSPNRAHKATTLFVSPRRACVGFSGIAVARRR